MFYCKVTQGLEDKMYISLYKIRSFFEYFSFFTYLFLLRKV
nr:MAG TPA: hypothetical protein [Caudoviricetes sp.]